MFSGLAVADVEGLIDDFEAQAQRGGPLLAASIAASRARIGHSGGTISYEEVETRLNEEATLLRQTGSEHAALGSLGYLGVAARMQGDDELHERIVRSRLAGYEAIGDRIYVANLHAELALVLCRRGNVEQAAEALERGRALASPDDVADRLSLDTAEAYLHALRGEADAARALLDGVREAAAELEMVPMTEDLIAQDAAIRRVLGDDDEARRLLRGLAERAEARGFQRMAERHRADLAGLD